MGLSLIMRKILDVINQSERELTPREIADITEINHSTVKNYVRKLLGKGKIIQSRYGFYSKLPTHGMGKADKKVHNFLVVAENLPWLDFSDDVKEEWGSVTIRVQFGLKRKKITGWISCDPGMVKDTFIFALKRVDDIVKLRTGHELAHIEVKTLEVGRDLKKFRIDPAKSCFTWKGLFGVVERIYQKEDTVRVERKFTKKMNIDEAISLFDLPRDNIQQGLYIVSKKVDALVDAQRYQNSKITEGSKRLDGLEKSVREPPSWIEPLLSSISDVQSELNVLNKGQMVTDQKISRLLDANIIQTANVNRLTETLEKLISVLTKPQRKRKAKKKPKPKPLWKRLLRMK